jgi:hypothetical protein
MKIKQHKSRIKTLRVGDKGFILTDNLTTCPRASFEISDHCPKEYQRILLECWGNGWIKPVAHLYSNEYLKDLLSE